MFNVASLSLVCKISKNSIGSSSFLPKVKSLGKKEREKMAEMGPVPVEADVV